MKSITQLILELRSSKKKDTLLTLRNLKPGDKFWIYNNVYNECLTVEEIVCNGEKLEIIAKDDGMYTFNPLQHNLIEGGLDCSYIIYKVKNSFLVQMLTTNKYDIELFDAYTNK